MAHRHMLLPAVLSLLLRAATAVVLSQCDGSVNVPEECLFDDNTLSYCECNLCQTYRQTEVYGGTPSNGPGISTSYMIPGVQSNHSLCLHHWTFFKVPTRSPGHDGVDEPKGVVFYLDTDYKSDQMRFTSVDVLEITRGALPDGWSEVHSLDYPKDVFGLNQITYSPDGKPIAWAGDRARWLLRQDSYIYTSGYDDEGEGCRGAQKEFVYIAVRCGNPQDCPSPEPNPNANPIPTPNRPLSLPLTRILTLARTTRLGSGRTSRASSRCGSSTCRMSCAAATPSTRCPSRR